MYERDMAESQIRKSRNQIANDIERETSGLEGFSSSWPDTSRIRPTLMRASKPGLWSCSATSPVLALKLSSLPQEEAAQPFRTEMMTLEWVVSMKGMA